MTGSSSRAVGRNDWSAHSTDHTKVRTYLVLGGYLCYSVTISIASGTIHVPLVLMTLLTRRICEGLNISPLFQLIWVDFNLFQSIHSMYIYVSTRFTPVHT